MDMRKANIRMALATVVVFGMVANEAAAKPGGMPPPRITPGFNQAASAARTSSTPARPIPPGPRGQGTRPGPVFNNKAGQTSKKSTALPRRTTSTPATPNPRVWTGWLSSLKAKLLPSRGSGTPSSKPGFNAAAASSATLSFRKAAQGPMVTRPAHPEPGLHPAPRP